MTCNCPKDVSFDVCGKGSWDRVMERTDNIPMVTYSKFATSNYIVCFPKLIIKKLDMQLNGQPIWAERPVLQFTHTTLIHLLCGLLITLDVSFDQRVLCSPLLFSAICKHFHRCSECTGLVQLKIQKEHFL
uniref:Uncharacterized protein n=1 Tax=Anguilla anguilla TaxID=7936 RepID=A0A0E9WVT2_ANGAN